MSENQHTNQREIHMQNQNNGGMKELFHQHERELVDAVGRLTVTLASADERALQNVAFGLPVAFELRKAAAVINEAARWLFVAVREDSELYRIMSAPGQQPPDQAPSANGAGPWQQRHAPELN